jgi:hypothetical protein
MMRRAIEGWIPDLLIDPKTIPAKSGPPIAARLRTYMLEPTSIAELRATGRWWKKTLLGPHSGPVSRDEGFGEHAMAPPELWHFDDVVWLRRSAMGPLMARARKGESLHDLVLVDADGLTEGDVARFWSDFLPSVASRRHEDWGGLRSIVHEIRAKYGREQLYRFERIAGRYGMLLFARLEPLFLDKGLAPAFGRVHASLDVPTHYHLGLLARHILTEGRAAYDAVALAPARANEHLPELTMQSGAYLLALFRYEIYVNQSQKLRLMEVFLEAKGRRPPTEAQKKSAERLDRILRRILGPIEMVDFLKTQFARPQDSLDVAESWPSFVLAPDGSLVRSTSGPESAPEAASKPSLEAV